MHQPPPLPRHPPYARLMAALLGCVDPLLQPLRAQAVHRLALPPGAHVLDVGCGTGSSFPALRAAVGPTGRVVGIERSPDLAARAYQRIQRHAWPNVHLLVADAQSVQLREPFAGLLLFAVHEVLTAPAALDNLVAHLQADARVVAVGVQPVRAFPMALLNPLLRLASRQWLAGAAPLDAQPWRGLEARVVGLTVEERVGGLFYVVAGVVRAPSP